jgi:hypothetical protein
MRKILVEFQYNDEQSACNLIEFLRKVIGALNIVTPSIDGMKVYKNIANLTVDSASEQCRECPAYFTQESLE